MDRCILIIIIIHVNADCDCIPPFLSTVGMGQNDLFLSLFIDGS